MHVHIKIKTLATLVLSLALLTPAFAGDNPDRGDLKISNPPRHPEPTYQVEAGMDGEIYPVFANYASLQKQDERSFGVVSVKVSNPSDGPLRERIAVKVAGWSDQEIQMVDLAPGASKVYMFAPTFLPRLYNNHEIAAATADVSITDMAGHGIYETTAPVRLRSSEDMYWGNHFRYAPFIASWVTPHDLHVESVLKAAKAFIPDHRLPGYESWKSLDQQEQETYREARAIFTALKQMGLSYVKSSATFGDHKNVSERVRMPRVSLGQSSANCIDAAVMYASLFENLGMDPTVVIVPGHAYVGVRVAPNVEKFLFIDVALTGRTTFEAAVASAQKGLARYPGSSVTKVMIQQARDSGIYPMP
jgi:hypothetical protein